MMPTSESCKGTHRQTGRPAGRQEQTDRQINRPTDRETRIQIHSDSWILCRLHSIQESLNPLHCRGWNQTMWADCGLTVTLALYLPFMVHLTFTSGCHHYSRAEPPQSSCTILSTGLSPTYTNTLFLYCWSPSVDPALLTVLLALTV